MQRVLIEIPAGEDPEHLLERCHALCELQGALETESGVEVYGAVGIAARLAEAGLSVQCLPLPGGPEPTGLEGDAVLWLARDLWVRPPWVAAPAAAGIELCIPRGMGFGSGEHASTQAILRLMHATWPAGAQSCNDVGTGSGILLAYARARGCPQLRGCDVHAPSVREARELLPEAQLTRGGPETLGGAADVVLANMFAAELLDLRVPILAAWNGQGGLYLAGMRRGAEEQQVQRAFGLRAPRRQEQDGFVALVASAVDRR